jgi:hypothetical protein
MPLQLLVVFEIVSRLENLQLKVHYVFCLYIYIYIYRFLVLDFFLSSLFPSCLCTFNFSNAFAILAF